MKMNPAEIKKLMPFIVVGGIAGVYGLYVKSKSGGNISTTSNSDGVTGSTQNTNSADTNEQINNLASQTNVALADQKSYYNDLIASLTDKLALENTTISALTSDLHSTQTSVDQNTTATNKIIVADGGIMSTLTSIQNSITTLKNSALKPANIVTKPTVVTKPVVKPVVVTKPVVKPIAKTTLGNYTIVKGDTLTSIAKRYGTTVSKLVSLNGIKNPNVIIAGNNIKVK